MGDPASLPQAISLATAGVTAMTEPILEIDGLSAGYDDALVLHDVSLSLAPGQCMALLGRNGMGKSTLLASIMGHTRLRKGTIRFRGMDITHLAPHLRARAGIAWVAQERDIFPSLTLEENLTVACRAGFWSLESVYTLFPRLRERRRNMGNQLSGGEQQMLAIGRALATNPSLLLLDEPLEGLAPVIVEELISAIKRLRGENGMSMILVEQHARTALGMADTATVLERGRVVHASTAMELTENSNALDRLVGLGGGTLIIERMSQRNL